MSKDIWHTADVKPKSLKTFVYKTDKGHIGTSMLAIDSGWNPVLLPEFYSMNDFDIAERIVKWCYLDDLLACEKESSDTKKKLDDLSDKIGKLETELDRTRKALSYAIGVIQTVAKMSDKLSREYGETLVEQLDNIQAYCWQEGYVLTHEEDLSKALEQKE